MYYYVIVFLHLIYHSHIPFFVKAAFSHNNSIS